MSDSQNAGFGKFVPGFDFLQNLAKGASDVIPQMPNLASWIAPTLNVEDLEKRISELKTVHFWLDQNSKALSATIQALEVQKMTLATLKGMNVNIGDMANVFKAKAEAGKAPASKTISELAAEAEAAAHKVREASQAASAAAAAAATPESAPAATPTPAMVDPMQLWGALTQQFQTIAASALKEVGANAAIDATKNMAAGMAKEAVEATKKAVASVVNTSTPAKPAAKAPAKAAVKSAAKPAAKKAAK
jgi:hypothetical protein